MKDWWNARITEASIEIEDHGILTFWLQVDMEGSGGGIGGFGLDGGRPRKYCSVRFIREILDCLEVKKWGDLKGQLVRIPSSHLGEAMPKQIGHILKDQSIDLEAIMKEEKGE